MKIYQIYCITNIINLKKYIGFTGKSINYRFCCHVSKSKKENNSRLHKAIKKYGKENFKIESLCCSKDRDYALNVLEPYFIKLHNTIEEGYNCQPGGKGISYHTEKTKKILSEKRKKAIKAGWISPWKGRKHSIETIEKMEKSQRKFTQSKRINAEKYWTKERKIEASKRNKGKNNPFYGKKHKNGFRAIENHNEETKNKLSNLWEVATPTGEKLIIRNLKNFCKKLSLSLGTLCMTSVGKRKHHKGYSCKILEKGLNSH